jgi:hypothetical protein
MVHGLLDKLEGDMCIERSSILRHGNNGDHSNATTAMTKAMTKAVATAIATTPVVTAGGGCSVPPSHICFLGFQRIYAR